MAEKLTREQFQARYGMTVDEYRAQNDTTAAPKQRRFVVDSPVQAGDSETRTEDKKPEPSTWQRIRSAVSMANTIADTALASGPAILKRIANDEPVQPDTIAADAVAGGEAVKDAQRNAVIGIGTVPTAVPAMVDLAVTGVPSVVSGIVSPGPEGRLASIGREFTSRMVSPETKQKIIEAAQAGATEDQIEQMVSDNLPAGIRMNEDWTNYLSSATGLDRKTSDMTGLDDVEQVVASAFVGLPKSAVSAISRAVTKRLGTSITENIGARVATKALEVATPITLPMNPSNVAANAIVGSGVSEAIRGVQGLDTAFDYSRFGSDEPTVPQVPIPVPRPDGLGFDLDVSYDPRQNPDVEVPDMTVQLAAGAALAAFSIPGARQLLKKTAADAIKTADEIAIDSIDLRGGKTLAQQSTVMEPTLSPTTGLIDRNAGVTKAANKFRDPADSTVVPELDAIMSKTSAMNNAEAVNNTLNYGVLEGLPRTTVPFAKVQQAAAALPPEQYKRFNTYMYARMRQNDIKLNEANLQKEFQAELAASDMHRTRVNTKEYNKSQARLAEIQEKLRAIREDLPESRPSMKQMDRAQAEAAIRYGDTVPEFKELEQAFRTITNDLVDFAENEIIDTEEALRRKQTRGLYVKLQEAEGAGIKNALWRRASKFMREATATPAESGIYPQLRTRNIGGDGAVVNQPMDILAALRETIMDTVQAVHVNKARREVVERLMALPNASGKLLRKIEFDAGNGRKVSDVTEGQLYGPAKFAEQVEGMDNVVRVHHNGKISFYEFADKATARALQFAPVFTVPVMHAMRKAWQQGTTGVLAPWFAPKALMFDISVGLHTNRAGRSFGMVDTLARKLSNESATVNWAMDKIADPTAYISSGLAVPTQLVRRAQRAIGLKVADDLAKGNGFFSALASTPIGEQLLAKVGHDMVRSFDNSASGMMFRNMSTSFGHMQDNAKKIDEYKIAASGASNALKPFWQGYVALLESFQMGARHAFFTQNYSRLMKKYNGAIPQKELDLLIRDTQRLSGDMSKVSGSKFIQGATDLMPYANTMMQGTAQMLHAMVPPSAARAANKVLGTNMLEDRSENFWSKVITGTVLPLVVAHSMWEGWPEGSDYVNNRTPDWTKLGTIAFPSVEALTHRLETGEWPKFEEKHVQRFTIAPEMSAVSQAALAGLRGLGILGPAPAAATDATPLSDLKSAFAGLASFMTPPIVSTVAALQGQQLDSDSFWSGGGVRERQDLPKGGANGDDITYGSAINQTLFDVMGSLFGGAGKIAMQSIDTALHKIDETGSYADAALKAMDVAGYEVGRRATEQNVPGVWNAAERMYASTPEAKYVWNAKRDLEPIVGQQTVENDKDGNLAAMEAEGLTVPQKIKNPALKIVSQLVYDTINKKGDFKASQELYTALRTRLTGLESSRHSRTQDEYHTQRNDIVRRQQLVLRQQATILRNLENSLQQKIGPKFEEAFGAKFNFKNLAKAVREDTSQ